MSRPRAGSNRKDRKVLFDIDLYNRLWQYVYLAQTAFDHEVRCAVFYFLADYAREKGAAIELPKMGRIRSVELPQPKTGERFEKVISIAGPLGDLIDAYVAQKKISPSELYNDAVEAYLISLKQRKPLPESCQNPK